jgi:hypothetical protein
MDALLESINFQLKNWDRQELKAILKKSKAVYMTFETGFSVQ